MLTGKNAAVTERILQAAEELFARDGYDGATMRNITRKAGVNLAASHYHLGDKRDLYCRVLERRLRPINEARLAELAHAEEEAAGRPVAMPRILDIMIRPLFELSADTTHGGQFFGHILGRSLAEPMPFMAELLEKEFHPAMARFGQALRRHVPNLAPGEFLWRLSFVIGAMHHAMTTLPRMEELTRGICRNNDAAAAIRCFIPFAVITFNAPEEVQWPKGGAT